MEYSGPDNLVRQRKAVILNSRQSKTPRGADQWVQNSFRAVGDALARDCAVITSVGMNTWEFLVWAVGRQDGEQIVILPVDKQDDPKKMAAEILADFELDPGLTGFMFFPAEKGGVRGKSAWAERDRTALSLANLIYPVSIRSSGNLERLISEYPAKSSQAILDFSTEYCPESRLQNIGLRESELSAEIRARAWNYLTHYTRTSYSPWPGETAAQFYQAIYSSQDEYPHSALCTLQRILSERRLRASDYHIRDGFRVVGFTELPPAQAIKLIRWRARFVRWSFEPYGIAVEKEAARSLGLRPVTYADPAEFASLPAVDRPFFQNPGAAGADWRPEAEWRQVGDLDLNAIPPDRVKLIVRNESDKAALCSPFEILALT